jgi:hypothetical protein
MKVIARGLWPGRARAMCDTHNCREHEGVPTAHVDPDELSTTWVPQYKVWCPVCEEDNDADGYRV